MPGPGNYQVPLSTFQKARQATTFGRKKRKMSTEPSEGQTAFLPQKAFYNPRGKNAFSFGRSKLCRTLLGPEKQGLPGPGQYNSAKFLTKKKHPRCVIGSAKRVLGAQTKETPGVGAYDVTKASQDRRKRAGFSIGRNHRFKSLGVGVTRSTSRASARSPTRSTSKRYFPFFWRRKFLDPL